jgi:hypothetical protein
MRGVLAAAPVAVRTLIVIVTGRRLLAAGVRLGSWLRLGRLRL